MENNSSEFEVVQANNDLSSNDTEISKKDKDVSGNVVISIEEMWKQLPRVNRNGSIYRVPKELREMNPKAYAPQLISIGPFHHGTQKDLIANEQYKIQGFFNFLCRINNNNDKMESLEEEEKESLEEEEDESIVKIESSSEDFLKTKSLKFLVEKARGWVKEARNCYVEPINMKDEKFVIMMLVDACFILEFFILYYCIFHHRQDNVYFSSLHPEITLDIFNDLMKLENQVPFFLLQHLYDLLPEDSIPTLYLTDLTRFSLCNGSLVDQYNYHFVPCSNIKPKHLVDFLRFYFVPLPLPIPDDMQPKKKHENKKPHVENSEKADENCPSITEIYEAGVIIKKAENSQLITNINFKNGVLEIPPLYIYDDFETTLRNLIAFEYFPIEDKNDYVIQYVSFLNDLISTEKDVRLLVKAGVIINRGGSDKQVSHLFNSLCKFVSFPSSSHYDPISKDLCEHCNGKWNKAKASLKHNYFNTPWAFISFFAASFLILLTLLQTIFSAISAFPN